MNISVLPPEKRKVDSSILSRVRARHTQARRLQLWLGTGNRGPMTASGIYQVIARRGRECGVEAFPHRFEDHFSRTWLDRGGAEGDLMELNGWTSPQMLRRYGASARSARARRSYDHIMDDAPLPEPAGGRRWSIPPRRNIRPYARYVVTLSVTLTTLRTGDRCPSPARGKAPFGQPSRVPSLRKSLFRCRQRRRDQSVPPVATRAQRGRLPREQVSGPLADRGTESAPAIIAATANPSTVAAPCRVSVGAAGPAPCPARPAGSHIQAGHVYHQRPTRRQRAHRVWHHCNATRLRRRTGIFGRNPPSENEQRPEPQAEVICIWVALDVNDEIAKRSISTIHRDYRGRILSGPYL